MKNDKKPRKSVRCLALGGAATQFSVFIQRQNGDDLDVDFSDVTDILIKIDMSIAHVLSTFIVTIKQKKLVQDALDIRERK